MRMSLIVATVLAVTAPSVRAEKRALSPALFDLSGYTKSEDQGLAGLAGQAQLSPEQQQSLDAARRQQEEALKKMTPEQRRCYEEMMKSIQGAGADPRGS
jgi:Spy/CpxP family protein refolding chaperone